MRSEVVVTAWRSAAVVLALVLSAMPALAQKALVSVKTDQAPTIDGTVDAAWEKAPAYKIALIETPYKPEGFKGITKTNVTMKSMYDKDNIYVLLQWEDPTRSIERAPWVATTSPTSSAGSATTSAWTGTSAVTASGRGPGRTSARSRWSPTS
jgi:hypothetical protein